MTSAPWLVGDVGGTSARFGLVDPGDAAAHDERVFHTGDFPAFVDAVERYFAEVAPAVRPTAAAVAFACPVVGDEVRLTNASWEFSIAAARTRLGLERFVALNDFTALALSLPALEPARDLSTLKDGTASPDAPLALLGPGTGLGVSGLVPWRDGARSGWTPLATEGGHQDLTVGDEREWAIYRRLRTEHGGHVSAERVLSGPGLPALHAALAAIDGVAAAPLSPSEVTAAAATGDALAREAIALFSGWLGSFAGDLVLTLGALGGCYVGGGVVGKLGELFDRERFVARFLAKGRFAAYLEPVPVWLITHPTPALIGSARALAANG